MIAAVGSCQPIRAASGANSSRYNTGVNNTGVELVLRAIVCSQPEEVNPSMPRKAQHPKDRPAIRARKLDAMATLALAIKCELDALQATTPFGHDYVFRIRVTDLGRHGLFSSLTLTSLERAQRTERGLIMFNGKVIPLANIPPLRAALRPLGSLAGDLVRYLPILAMELEDIGIFHVSRCDIFTYQFKTIESKGRFTDYKVPLRDALLLVNSAIPRLVEQQSRGYRLNEGLESLINTYLGVLECNRRGTKVTLNWGSLVKKFKEQPGAGAFSDLHLLLGAPGQRKRAGEVAQSLGLIRILSTRQVELRQSGIDHAAACWEGARNRSRLPSPFA